MVVKLWIGGTGRQVSVPALAGIVEKYGTVLSIIKRNGYSFIEMEDGALIDDAVRDLSGLDVGGSPISVERSSAKDYDQASWPASARVFVFVKTEDENMAKVNEVAGDAHKVMQCAQPNYHRLECTNRAEATALAAKFQDDQAVFAFVGAHTRQKAIDVPLPFPIRMSVRPQLAGAIIGHAGKNITQVMEKSGAIVEVAGRIEESPDSERGVTIKGSQNKTVTAFFETVKFMAQQEATTQIHLYIPHDYVGQLIGKQGSTIKNILERSEAAVEIISSQYPPEIQPYKVVSLSGTPQQMTTAFSLIAKKFSSVYLRNLQKQYNLPELRSDGRDGYKTVQVHFPVNLAGSIIGKGGNIIRSINTKTAATLTVQAADAAVNGQRVCEIKGLHTCVVAALTEVLDKLKVAGCAHCTLKIPVSADTAASVAENHVSLSRTSMSQISVEEGDSSAVIVSGGLTSVKVGYGLVQKQH